MRIRQGFERIWSGAGIERLQGQELFQGVYVAPVPPRKGKLGLAEAKGTPVFAVIDAGDIVAVQDVALVHAHEILRQLPFKALQGLVGTDPSAVNQYKIGGIVVGLQVEDILGVQVLSRVLRISNSLKGNNQ